jgi:hypothetical protein
MDDPIKYNKPILALAMLMIIGSCTEHFEELNTDPNYPTDVPAINIFTQVIIHSMDMELSNPWAAFWAQQWSGAQMDGWQKDRYNIGNYAYLRTHYYTDLLDLEIIIRKTSEKIENGPEEDALESRVLKAAAKIMRVWIFHLLTDMLGDIPYSESLTGLDEAIIYQPKYDTQESIYMDLLRELDEANDLLDDLTMVKHFGDGDLFFGGDPGKWKKFGNSLKIRILNRCSGTPWSFHYNMAGTGAFTTGPGAAAYPHADEEMAAILNDPAGHPVISSNSDNVMLTYPGLPPYRQPVFEWLSVSTYFVISETMVNWLKDRNDPRLPVYARETQDYEDGNSDEPYVGQQNGREQEASLRSLSRLGMQIGYEEDASLYVLTYDEMEFIRAEYYLRQGDVTAARDAYERGIIASMEKWGVPLDANTYLLEPKVNWDSAFNDGEKYQRILEQKWAAMFGQGWQAWHEARRTGFPARVFEYELEGSIFPDLGMPMRMSYPTSEETENHDHWSEARARQNIEDRHFGFFSTDGIKSQMWWHTRKNPIPTVTDPPVLNNMNE